MRDQGLKTILMAGDALAVRVRLDHRTSRRGRAVHLRSRSAQEGDREAIVDKFQAKSIDQLRDVPGLEGRGHVRPATDGKKVAAAMKKSGKWDTVIGPISYTAEGDITILDYVVYKWDSKGGYEELPAKPAS